MRKISTATISMFAFVLSGALLSISTPTMGAEAKAQASNSGQSGKNANQQGRAELSQWTYDELYRKGWSAEELLDADAYGPGGDQIGEFENIIVSADGKINAAIIEGGGFLDIADTHFRVPWNEVDVSQDMERVTVPVTADNVENYALFEGEYVPMERREFRVTELIDDYALIENRIGFGYVDDVVFGNKGQLLAVVVEPDVGYDLVGPYAYPYHAYNFDPGLDYYALPYTESEVAELENFDYDAMNNGPGKEQSAKKPSGQKATKSEQ